MYKDEFESKIEVNRDQQAFNDGAQTPQENGTGNQKPEMPVMELVDYVEEKEEVVAVAVEEVLERKEEVVDNGLKKDLLAIPL